MRRSLTALALATALLAGGCAGTNPPAPPLAETADYKYLIGPGDSLQITVWRNPDLSATVPVRPDGKITAPLVEDVTAIGKSPTELAREMEQRLRKYIQDPVVTIVVASFVGAPGEQVRIVGQAAKPAGLPYRQNMTLLDAIIAVGGLTPYAAGNRAVLMRPSENNRQYTVRIEDLIKRGDVSANVQLRPGDVIIIPEGWF
jgi:polysaccharide export outer membrane protein